MSRIVAAGVGPRSVDAGCYSQPKGAVEGGLVAVIRRVAIGVTMLILLSTASVSAATKTIEVFNFGYNPSPTKVKLGTYVHVAQRHGPPTHTSTADLFGLWSEGMSAGTTSDPVAFKQSGSFAYHCTVHASMHGKVNVRMKATPTTGTLDHDLRDPVRHDQRAFRFHLRRPEAQARRSLRPMGEHDRRRRWASRHRTRAGGSSTAGCGERATTSRPATARC